ncbi:ubiquitin carboxyl-terminal hydrolase 16, partial [Tanacetum coccineum]
QEALFSLKIHYTGCFTESPGRNGRNIMYYSFLKPDMNLDTGLYALCNDDDVRIMSEYIRLRYKMIEVYIEHDKTTVFTYIEAAYNTPSKKYVIMEYPEEEETTLIGLAFGGYLRSKIKCMKCGGKSEKNERMMDLNVEIEGDIGTLEEALKKYTSTEMLDGENNYKCSRCKSNERA